MTAVTDRAPAALMQDAAAVLRRAGVPSPEYDARALLAHVFGVPVAGLLTADRVDDDAATAYRTLVGQRADRIPLQHLTGRAGFRRLDLAVGPGVFIPRPETEVLVDWVLRQVAGIGAPVVVDLCSGSGALAFAIADEVPRARVYAVELDASAVAWSRRNLDELSGRDPSLAERVRIIPADVATALPELDGTVDLVVANPPYIPLGAHTEPEVERHDPALALWGGSDGLDVIRVVRDTAARLLRDGGSVAIEHADVQGVTVPVLFAVRPAATSGSPAARSAGGMARCHSAWRSVQDHPDLAGRPRFTTAVRAVHTVHTAAAAPSSISEGRRR